MHEPALLESSSVDSARFGLAIARGRVEHDTPLPNAKTLEGCIRKLEADIAILRAPAGSELQSVLALLPWPSFHADTLVYYEKVLDARSPPARKAAGWSVEQATASDLPRIRSIARSSFTGYRSHYHANAMLDRELILQGYEQWAVAYLSEPSPEQLTFIAKEGDRTLGFLTCRYDIASASCEIVLNAVAPEEARRGVYSFLLAESLRLVSRRGDMRAEISTQVWNYAVQKVWARQGFALSKAYDTYHINAMLSCDKPPPIAGSRKIAP